MRRNGKRMEILDVGREEDELRRALADADAREGTTTTIAVPGGDAWWDTLTAWPPPAEHAERAAHALPIGATVFLVNPLRHCAWNPLLAEALFRFVRFKYGETSALREVARRGPTTVASPAQGADFSAVEWSEIGDALSTASPSSKLLMQPTVHPPSLTPTRRRARTLRRALAAVGVFAIGGNIAWLKLHLGDGWARVGMGFALLVVVYRLAARISELDKAAAREAPRRQ